MAKNRIQTPSLGSDNQVWQHIGFMAPGDLYDRFVAYCKANNLNRSAVLRDMLTDHLDDQDREAYLAEQEKPRKAPARNG